MPKANFHRKPFRTYLDHQTGRVRILPTADEDAEIRRMLREEEFPDAHITDFRLRAAAWVGLFVSACVIGVTIGVVVRLLGWAGGAR